MENSVIDRVIVEINELTDVVGNNVEVPRDPLHINTHTGKKTRGDGYLEPSAAKLELWNQCSQYAQHSGYLYTKQQSGHGGNQ